MYEPKFPNILEQQEKMMKSLTPHFPIMPDKFNHPIIEMPPDPTIVTNKLLTEQNEKIDDLSTKLEEANLEISKQTQELKSIHYENEKLNSQIITLNKTIDTQNDELAKLRNINTELKTTNRMLKEDAESNRGYWIKTVLVAIFTTVLAFLLGKYM